MVETERLSLLAWDTRCDAELVRLAAMPEITRYIGTGEVWPRERALDVAVRQREHWKQHGFGWRGAVLLSDPEVFVGFIGLNYVAPGQERVSSTDVEIGWWIDPARWGRGYAREGAAAVKDSFGEPVLARIHAENEASKRVAAALGLRFAFRITGAGGVPVDIYR